MPLTTKQIAEYVELINNKLDKIPAKNAEDFPRIVEALEHIIQPRDGKKSLERLEEIKENLSNIANTELKEHLFDIAEMLIDSDLFYTEPATFPQYQAIIQDRITIAQDQFKNMRLAEKEAYIQNQQSVQAEAQAVAAKMKNITESKAYQDTQELHNTGAEETEEQQLARLEREFRDERLRQQILTNPAVITNPEIGAELCANLRGVRKLIETHITIEQLIELDPAIRTAFLINANAIQNLVHIARMTLAQLVAMDPAIRSELLRHRNNDYICLIIRLFTLDQLLTINAAIRYELFINAMNVSQLINHVHITLDQLIAMEPSLRTQFLTNAPSIVMLTTTSSGRNVGVMSLDQLIALEPPIRTEFIQNADAVLILIGANISLKQLLEIEPEICVEFIQNAESVKTLIKDALIPFDQLVTMDPEIRSELISNPASFLELNKNKHISLEQLERLNRPQVHTVLSNQNSAESSQILSALKQTSRKPWGRS